VLQATATPTRASSTEVIAPEAHHGTVEGLRSSCSSTRPGTGRSPAAASARVVAARVAVASSDSGSGWLTTDTRRWSGGSGLRVSRSAPVRPDRSAWTLTASDPAAPARSVSRTRLPGPNASAPTGRTCTRSSPASAVRGTTTC
jgi:hypothetical protein